MKLSQRGLDAIKSHEGLRLRAYDDGAGVLTIGYGHTSGVKAGDQITKEQADDFLRSDVDWAEETVRDAVHVSISQAQFDALVSLTFNIGARAFRDSTLLRKLNAGDYEGAAQEFVRWNQAGGKVMPGLTRRRLAERDMFASSDAPITPESGAPAAPDAPAITSESGPAQEKPVAPLIPVLLQGLASSLFNIFAPLAREKVESVLTKQGLPPGVGTQLMTVAVDAAKQVTGLADPVQATAAVLAKPDELGPQVQAATLDALDRMMPALSQMHRWEQDAWAAEEASRAAASERMRGDPHAEGIDTYLTRGVMRLAIGVLVVTAILLGLLAWLKADATIIASLGTLFVAGASTVWAKLGTRYDHAYGSSRSSSAKDVVIGALTRGKP